MVEKERTGRNISGGFSDQELIEKTIINPTKT
jgi:hypothetical protein